MLWLQDQVMAMLLLVMLLLLLSRGQLRCRLHLLRSHRNSPLLFHSRLVPSGVTVVMGHPLSPVVAGLLLLNLYSLYLPVILLWLMLSLMPRLEAVGGRLLVG